MKEHDEEQLLLWDGNDTLWIVSVMEATHYIALGNRNFDQSPR
jgi:hypothetical protein